MNFIRRHSLVLAFVATATLLAAIAFLITSGAQKLHDNELRAQLNYGRLDRLDAVQTGYFQAITGSRGYLLTGDKRYLEDFAVARESVRIRVDELSTLVAGDKEKSVSFGRLRLLIDERMILSTKILGMMDNLGPNAAQAVLRGSNARDLDIAVTKLTSALESSEYAELTDSRRKSSAEFLKIEITALTAMPLCLLIVGFSFRSLSRENRERRRSELVANAASVELEATLASFRMLSSKLTALTAFTGMLQSCDNRQELLDITQRAMAGLAPGLGGTLYLIRSSRDNAEAVATWGQHLAKSSAVAEPGHCWSARRGQPFHCHALNSEVKCGHVESALTDGVVATACLPLSAQGEVLGWIFLSGPGPGPLPDSEVIAQAAEQLALALANVRLRESLRQQSIRDPLTGLFNRRYLEESLAREISRCQRRQLPLVVMMLDIDHFKAFNDLHGHPGGDELLAAFGRLVQSHCRPEDIPCRYGGEEFTLILPEAEQSVGLERARQLLAATAQMVIGSEGSRLSRVTVSIGLAVLPRDGDNTTSLIEAADRALYGAKAAGRNQVRLASEPAAG